jgi:pimeloyl-ACP methyl ester carboxylesterase
VSNPQRLYTSPGGMAAVQAAYDEALARLTCAYDVRSVATSFGQTRVIVSGPDAAPAVVLLHGWNTNASGWWPQVNAWGRDYRLYAPDTIGQAGRSAPVRPSIRGDSYGRWASDVLAALELDRPALVGSSGGAWLILRLAEVNPGRIGRAVLLSPAGIASVRFGFILRHLAIGAVTPRADLAQRQARLVSPPPLRIDPAHLHWQEPLVRYYRGLLPPPTLPDGTLRRLSAPTLVLVGEREVVFDPRRVLERARRLMPDVSAEMLPGAGHDMTFDHPEGVNERVLRFLQVGQR